MAALAGAVRHAAAAVNRDGAEFFQAMRLALTDARRVHPELPLMGEGERPGDEPVRLRAAAGMRYPSVELSAVARPAQCEDASPAERRRLELEVAFLGLTGPSGVLPDHYTDFIVARRRARDPAVAAFFDLFNHRTATLFYRAWARSRLPVRFEESQQAFRDPMSRLLAAVLGLGLDVQAGRAAQADGALLGLAGRLGRRVRSAGALRSLVQALTAVPVVMEEFQGRWVPITPAEQTRLAAPRPGFSTFAALGVTAVAGERTWEVQSRFRLRLGPMGLADFRAFFVRGGVRARLSRALREAAGPALDFDLRLVLRREETPALQLGAADNPAFLGQTTWLCATQPSRDRDDAVLPAEL